MADNASLGAAKNAKNDEFYTQYSDIEAEMNAYGNSLSSRWQPAKP